MADADVKISFRAFADMKEANREFAKQEQQIEALNAKIKILGETAKRTASVKIDPVAGRMSGGSTGDAGIAAGMSQVTAQAQRLERIRQTAEKIAAMDATYGRFSAHRGVMANQAVDAQLSQRARNIDAAVKLHQIRKSEMAAAERRGADIQQLKESGDAMDSLAGKVLGLGLAYGTLKLTIGAALTEQKAFLDGYDRIAKVGAIAETELRIQGGLTKAEVTKSMPAMERALADIPAIAGETPEAMYQGALKLNTQLASSGFSKSDIESGKAFSATLKMKAASNRFGVGAGGEAADVQSLVTFLKGTGNLTPTAADVERVGGAISQLFRDSDLQFSNLEFLAPKASGLSAVGMNENLQLAAFATLRDVAGAEKAATGLDIITNRTATAATSNERVKALGELGLTPSDVAITKHGQQWLPTMLKLRERFAGLSEEQRGNLQTELFGEEGQRVAATLFAPGFLEKIREREQAATLQPDFLESVDEFRNSRLARMRRPDVALAFSRRRTDAAAGEFTWSERDQQDAAIRQLRDERAPWYERFANNLQDLPGRAVHWGMSWVVGAGESGTPNLANRLSELQQQQLENQERQIQVLERIEANGARPRNRNGNVENVGAN